MRHPDSLRAPEARRIAIAAQGLADPRPAGRIDRRHFRRVLERVQAVQLDSVNVLTRAHELAFFARLGPFDRTALHRWLWGSGEVLEYWGHAASVMPVELHPLLRWRMAGEHSWVGMRMVVRQHPELIDALHDAVRTDGPIGAGALEAERRTEPWWGWGPAKRALEHLFWVGTLTAVRSPTFERLYVAPERVLPREVLDEPTPSTDEALRQLLLVAARCHGVGTARDLADYFRLPVKHAPRLLDGLVAEGALVKVAVEGWRQPAYLHPAAARPRRTRAQALLSPFDSLVWERARAERLFGFEYRISIYTPAAQRTHGYYVLPFLLGDDLVARVDLKADRQAGVLRVRASHAEAGVDHDEVAVELRAELDDMATWLDLGEVEVAKTGDLAPALLAAWRA